MFHFTNCLSFRHLFYTKQLCVFRTTDRAELRKLNCNRRRRFRDNLISLTMLRVSFMETQRKSGLHVKWLRYAQQVTSRNAGIKSNYPPCHFLVRSKAGAVGNFYSNFVLGGKLTNVWWRYCNFRSGSESSVGLQ